MIKATIVLFKNEYCLLKCIASINFMLIDWCLTPKTETYYRQTT